MANDFDCGNPGQHCCARNKCNADYLSCYQGLCTDFGDFEIKDGKLYANKCGTGAFPFEPLPKEDGVYSCRPACDGPGEAWSPHGNPVVTMDRSPFPGGVCISPCILSGKAADPLDHICTWCNERDLPALPPNDHYKFFADTEGSEVKKPTCTQNPTEYFIRRDKPWGE